MCLSDKYREPNYNVVVSSYKEMFNCLFMSNCNVIATYCHSLSVYTAAPTYGCPRVIIVNKYINRHSYLLKNTL